MHRLDVHQPLTSYSLKLLPGDTIAQTFLVSRDNLDIVSICLRNPDRLLYPLQFTLFNQSGSILRQIDFSTANIDNQDCTKFQFPPVTDSANQIYQAVIAFPQPVNLPLISPVINVEAHIGSDYLHGTALLNDKSQPLDLHFKTFYYQSIQDTLVESLTQIPPRIVADWAFFMLWGSLIILLVIRILKKK